MENKSKESQLPFNIVFKTNYPYIDRPFYDKDNKEIIISLAIPYKYNSGYRVCRVNIPREVIMECIRDCDETEENNKDK